MPNLDVCGTIYPYPNVGDNPWGVPHIDWATAVSNCLTSLNTQVNISTMPNVFSTAGDIVYANPAVVPTRLGIGAIGQVLTVAGSGLPSWQAPASGSVSIPIGAIIAWNDFNGLLALDANFRYCDGSVINAPGSPIDSQTTDDLSGAYIVGYGTLGAGDIGTAPYDATPTGNANHQINLTHTHTISGAAIDGLLSTANGLTSSINTGTMSNDDSSIAADVYYVRDNDGVTKNDHHFAIDPGINDREGQHIHDMPSLSHNHTISGSGSTNTGSGLSSTQSIQPRSQRYRMIIRVL